MENRIILVAACRHCESIVMYAPSAHRRASCPPHQTATFLPRRTRRSRSFTDCNQERFRYGSSGTYRSRGHGDSQSCQEPVPRKYLYALASSLRMENRLIPYCDGRSVFGGQSKPAHGRSVFEQFRYNLNRCNRLARSLARCAKYFLDEFQLRLYHRRYDSEPILEERRW